MPEIRYYTVSQTREVKVAAHSVHDAVRIAEAAFDHGQNIDNGIATGKAPLGVWGNTRSRIREVQTYATEDRVRATREREFDGQDTTTAGG